MSFDISPKPKRFGFGSCLTLLFICAFVQMLMSIMSFCLLSDEVSNRDTKRHYKYYYLDYTFIVE